MLKSFFISSLFSLALIGCASTVHKDMVGERISARFSRLSDNELITLDQYQGKTVVLTFWATHCSSSRPVLPRMAHFAEKFKGRNDVVFLTASIDKMDNIEEVKTRIKSEGLTNFENMFSGNEDADEAFVALKGERLPYVVVIDPQGRLVDARYDDGFVYEMVK